MRNSLVIGMFHTRLCGYRHASREIIWLSACFKRYYLIIVMFLARLYGYRHVSHEILWLSACFTRYYLVIGMFHTRLSGYRHVSHEIILLSACFTRDSISTPVDNIKSQYTRKTGSKVSIQICYMDRGKYIHISLLTVNTPWSGIKPEPLQPETCDLPTKPMRIN